MTDDHLTRSARGMFGPGEHASDPRSGNDPAFSRPATAAGGIQQIGDRSFGLVGWLIAFVFFAVCMMQVALPVWSIGGLPVRAVAAIGALGLMFLIAPRSFSTGLRLSTSTLLLLLGFATLGTIVSIANEAPTGEVIREVIEIHIQSAVNFFLAVVMAQRLGARRTAIIVVLVVMISAAVAVAQFVGIDFGWAIRLRLAEISGQDLLSDPDYRRNRAMGLSFSPVTLGVQAFVAFAAYVATLDEPFRRFGKLDQRVLAAVLLLVVAMVLSGNRSPILACGMFVLVYLSIVWRRHIPWLVLACVLAVPLLQYGLDTLSGAGLRVADSGDESSEGRLALSYYGLLLFLSRPFGYGLTFDPTLYWHNFWDDVQWLPSTRVIQVYPLHNYILSMLNMYGIVVVVFIPKVLRIVKRHALATLCFFPYFINLIFHNGGPMWFDYFVWFAFGVCTVVDHNRAKRAEAEATPVAGSR